MIEKLMAIDRNIHINSLPHKAETREALNVLEEVAKIAGQALKSK